MEIPIEELDIEIKKDREDRLKNRNIMKEKLEKIQQKEKEQK